MANLNRVLIIGNLTRDPEVRYTPKGTAVADIALAVNRITGGGESGTERKEEVTFIDVTLWGRLAEIVEKYVKKGNPLFVEGRLHLDTWDDKTTNQKRSKLKVIGENIQLLGGRGAAENGEGAAEVKGPASPGAKRAAAANAKGKTAARDPEDPDLENIPF